MLFIHRHLVNQPLHVHLIVNRILAANEFHKSERVFSPDHQVGRRRAFVAVAFEHNDAVANDWMFARVHGMPVLSTIVAKYVFFYERWMERGGFHRVVFFFFFFIAAAAVLACVVFL
jgi:hypothetical protein